MRTTFDNADQPFSSPLYHLDLLCAVEVVLRSGKQHGLGFMNAVEGAFPADVLETLSRIAEQNSETAEAAKHVLAMVTGVSQGAAETKDPSIALLPEPHPLDFDWRFSESCLISLEARSELREAKNICILGAPSLFLHLVLAGRDVSLYDKNALAIQKLSEAGFDSAHECDLFQAENWGQTFDAVVADPPWYVEHYKAFVNAAANVTRCGAYLLLSVPPRLTRTEASADRQTILQVAFESGFDVVEVIPASLSYDSPPFEKSALVADGFTGFTWRSGDLFIFRRSSRANVLQKIELGTPSSDGQWKSCLLNGAVVKIKVESTVDESFFFHAASETGAYRLRTVSRRSPTRGKINLWTSRNLALWLSRTDCAISLGEALSRKEAENPLEVARQVSREYALDGESEIELARLAEMLLLDAGGLIARP